MALFGLSSLEIKSLEEKNAGRANVISGLLDKPKKLLATILITNNAINIAIVLLFAKIGQVLFQDITYVIFDLVSLRFTLEVVLATFLILMFGEILPKVYANRNKEKFPFLLLLSCGFWMLYLLR